MESTSERAREALEDHRLRTGFGPGRKQVVRARLEASIANGTAQNFAAELDQGAAGMGEGASPRSAAGRRVRIGGMLALALAAGLAGVWFGSGDRAVALPTPGPAEAAYAEQAPSGYEASAPRGPSDRSTPMAVPTEPEPEPSLGRAVVVELEVSPAPAHRRAPTRRSRPTAVGAAPGADADDGADESTLAAELALLRAARAAFAGGRGQAALAALDRHARVFPDGQLGPERAALRVEVLCELDPVRGREARQAFLDRHSGSGHANRVRGLTCTATD